MKIEVKVPQLPFGKRRQLVGLIRTLMGAADFFEDVHKVSAAKKRLTKELKLPLAAAEFRIFEAMLAVEALLEGHIFPQLEKFQKDKREFNWMDRGGIWTTT